MSRPFLTLQNISARYLNQTVFTDLNFEVRQGEHWAVVGESGAGKSSLLNAIAGSMNIWQGQVQHHYFQNYLTDHPGQDVFFTFRDLVAQVGQKHGFRNVSSNSAEFYYQQRYHASDSEDAATVGQYLVEQEVADRPLANWSVPKVVETFRLEHLLDKQLIKLSNGETKRLLLASALVKNPRLLLLDQPLTGLDVQTRKEFHQLISMVVASGVTVIMATTPEEVPHSITHVAVLAQGEIISTHLASEFTSSTMAPAQEASLNKGLLQELLQEQAEHAYDTILHLQNISIKYGQKQVLQEVDWHVRQGERWALLGPNGAGKTTLLSLLNGDNPQSFSQNITLFDRRRGTGETLWEIRKKIGFVSPELFQFFPYQNTCLQVVESGLYDTLGLFKQSVPAYAALAKRWLQLMGLEQEADKPLRQVSASAQRLCLLARALIKTPPLLILDEPCQGLDSTQVQRFKQLLEVICAQSNTTLIYVTHYPKEIPACVTKVLRLEQGVVQENALLWE